MRRRSCGRKFSCRLHAQAFQDLRELKNKAPEHYKNGSFILAALRYFNEHSPHGLDPNLTPKDRPSPEKTRRPVLRLLPAGTEKEGWAMIATINARKSAEQNGVSDQEAA